MLPDVNGFQYASKCEPGCFVPILMLDSTGRGDRVQGLALGADILQTFSAKELIARVNALHGGLIAQAIAMSGVTIA